MDPAAPRQDLCELGVSRPFDEPEIAVLGNEDRHLHTAQRGDAERRHDGRIRQEVGRHHTHRFGARMQGRQEWP